MLNSRIHNYKDNKEHEPGGGVTEDVDRRINFWAYLHGVLHVHIYVISLIEII